jgi:hypothetical protein
MKKLNISSQAMLVSSKFKLLGIYRKDEVATDHVNTHYEAKDVAKVTKCLLQGRHLKNIKAVRTAVCDFIGKHTLPWSEDGKRLLPATNFDKFQAQIEDFKHQWKIEVDDFIRRYDDILYESASMSGKLFEANAFPSKDDIKKKFSFSVNFSSVPNANDFRIDLIGESAEAEIRKSIEDQVSSEVLDGKKDILERITKNMKHLAGVLTDPNKQFRKSALTNAKEMATLLNDLNITQDKTITKLSESTSKLLNDFDPDTLVEGGQEIQQQAGEKVQEHMADLEQTASQIFG